MSALATLEERPLHADPLPRRHAWGCHDNAGLYVGSALHYDWRCPGCIEMAEAIIEQGHDTPQEWRRLPTDRPQVVTLAWLVERARYWQGAS